MGEGRNQLPYILLRVLETRVRTRMAREERGGGVGERLEDWEEPALIMKSRGDPGLECSLPECTAAKLKVMKSRARRPDGSALSILLLTCELILSSKATHQNGI
jgi:hypothetical protein